jgi:ferredoxin
MAKAGKRKKLPKEVAVINADNCTGCEACLEVCPVDCIYKVPGETFRPLQSCVKSTSVPPRRLRSASTSRRRRPTRTS